MLPNNDGGGAGRKLKTPESCMLQINVGVLRKLSYWSYLFPSKHFSMALEIQDGSLGITGWFLLFMFVLISEF